MFVNRSVMFVERSVTVITMYHIYNVFGVAVNAMIHEFSFAGRIKVYWSKVRRLCNCMVSSCYHNGKLKCL